MKPWPEKGYSKFSQAYCCGYQTIRFLLEIEKKFLADKQKWARANTYNTGSDKISIKAHYNPLRTVRSPFEFDRYERQAGISFIKRRKLFLIIQN